MEVAGGEVHALLGENGAGKSTLMAIAAGALAPDEGEVRIGGQPLAAHPDEARDLGLAVVYQYPAILDDLTVAENMVLAVQRRQRPPLGSARTWAAVRLSRIGADIDPTGAAAISARPSGRSSRSPRRSRSSPRSSCSTSRRRRSTRPRPSSSSARSRRSRRRGTAVRLHLSPHPGGHPHRRPHHGPAQRRAPRHDPGRGCDRGGRSCS